MMVFLFAISRAAFYARYNPIKVSQAVDVLKSPVYPTREELNKTLRFRVLSRISLILVTTPYILWF